MFASFNCLHSCLSEEAFSWLPERGPTKISRVMILKLGYRYSKDVIQLKFKHRTKV